MLSWSSLFTFAEYRGLETGDTTFINSARELVENQRPVKLFWNQNFAVFCKFNSIIIQNAALLFRFLKYFT